MAVAHDATTENAGSGSFSHTPVGTPTAVIIRISGRGNSDNTTEITGATYGGNTCTRQIWRSHSGGTSPPTGSRWVEIYTLENPPAGSQTVAITKTGSEARDLRVVASTYTGSLPSGQYGTPQADNNSGSVTSTSDITLSSATGGLCVDALVTGANGENHTPDSPQSEEYDSDADASATSRCAGSSEAGAASVAMGWSWTTGAAYAHVGIPIAVAGSQDVTVPVGSVTITGHAPSIYTAVVPLAPAAPTNCSGSATDDTITATFTDNSGGTATHRAYIKRSTDEVWTVAGDMATSVTSFTHYWLAQNTAYDVGFTSFDSDAESAMTTDTGITTGEVQLVSGSFL